VIKWLRLSSHILVFWKDVMQELPRTPKDYKREIKLRETKNFWVSEAGNKYRKNGWGVGDWPLYCLKIDSIRPIEQ